MLFVHTVSFSINKYDFDDAEFDELLQLTNDFVDGSVFFNPFMFFPDRLAKALQSEVMQSMDTLDISKPYSVPGHMCL